MPGEPDFRCKRASAKKELKNRKGGTRGLLEKRKKGREEKFQKTVETPSRLAVPWKKKYRWAFPGGAEMHLLL